METKICSYCHKEKSIEEFRFSQGRYRGECKKCAKIKYDIFKENVKKKYGKTYYQIYKEKYGDYFKEYRKNNPERLEYEKEYRKRNKDRIAQYCLEHRTHRREIEKKWREKNRIKIKQARRERYLREKDEPILKLKNQLRNMIKDSFKRKKYKKSKKVQEICGCSIDDLINYLIMTYEQNYNVKWDWKYAKDVHIDHKKPLKYATTEEDVIKLCHYSNLQLLKAEDNLKKGSKII